eukprot:1264150-Prymnesium_polylepis.2
MIAVWLPCDCNVIAVCVRSDDAHREPLARAGVGQARRPARPRRPGGHHAGQPAHRLTAPPQAYLPGAQGRQLRARPLGRPRLPHPEHGSRATAAAP